MTTDQLLNFYLSYNNKTGDFTWLLRPSIRSRRRAGDIAGTVNKHGYLIITLHGRLYCAQHIVWLFCFGKYPDGEIDHINGIKTDNRLSNLRDVSRIVNQQNRRIAPSNSKSGVLGVSFHTKVGKYRSVIQVNGKQKHLGYFDTTEEASRCYLEAKRKLHVGCTI